MLQVVIDNRGGARGGWGLQVELVLGSWQKREGCGSGLVRNFDGGGCHKHASTEIFTLKFVQI